MRVKSSHWYNLHHWVFAIGINFLVLDACATTKVDVNNLNYIRAVLLSKMVSYTYFPINKYHGDSEDIGICVIASNQTHLNKIAPFINIIDKRYSDTSQLQVRNIVINSVELNQVAERLPVECHIFYFSELSIDLHSMVEQIALRRGVLTVTDSKASLLKGAMVAFIEQQGKLKIYIKVGSLDESGVRLKSSILRIANRV